MSSTLGGLQEEGRVRGKEGKRGMIRGSKGGSKGGEGVREGVWEERE